MQSPLGGALAMVRRTRRIIGLLGCSVGSFQPLPVDTCLLTRSSRGSRPPGVETCDLPVRIRFLLETPCAS